MRRSRTHELRAATLLLTLVGAWLATALARADVHPLPPPIDAPGAYTGSSGFSGWSSQAPSTPSPFNSSPPPSSSTPFEYTDADLSWSWQWLPDGLIWHSYLAGVKEPRFALAMSHDKSFGTIWDVALGARVALLRHGTTNAYRPEGWEIDLEGAALPRLQPLEPSSTLVSTDYRIGIPVTYGMGNWQFKTGYSHISAHLGDEYMLAHPTVPRINYVRDSIMFAVGWYCTPEVRLFAEFDYAAGIGGGSAPGEFQFGAEYSPPVPGGAPFVAFYTDLREEVDYGGYFVVQAGWQRRGGAALRTFRLGVEYLNGMSPQFEFFNQFEQHVGFGLWYDF